MLLGIGAWVKYIFPKLWNYYLIFIPFPETLISTVAICAGSGTSVVSGIEADLYLTGEMLHHDVLEATQNGRNVILCNHSDSERGFLKSFQTKFQNKDLKVLVSEVDTDCLKTY